MYLRLTSQQEQRSCSCSILFVACPYNIFLPRDDEASYFSRNFVCRCCVQKFLSSIINQTTARSRRETVQSIPPSEIRFLYSHLSFSLRPCTCLLLEVRSSLSPCVPTLTRTCFPPFTTGVFAPLGYFDPLGLSKVPEPTLKKYRESEIKVNLTLFNRLCYPYH